jgi:hypothetical protein
MPSSCHFGNDRDGGIGAAFGPAPAEGRTVSRVGAGVPSAFPSGCGGPNAAAPAARRRQSQSPRAKTRLCIGAAHQRLCLPSSGIAPGFEVIWNAASSARQRSAMLESRNPANGSIAPWARGGSRCVRLIAPSCRLPGLPEHPPAEKGGDSEPAAASALGFPPWRSSDSECAAE